MTLIQRPQKQLNKKPVRVTFSSELLEYIESYCRWQGLPSISFFLEQAAIHILENDKDYKKYRKLQLSDIGTEAEPDIKETNPPMPYNAI